MSNSLEQQTLPFHAQAKKRLARLSDDDDIFIPILILYELRYSVSAALKMKAWGRQNCRSRIKPGTGPGSKFREDAGSRPESGPQQ